MSFKTIHSAWYLIIKKRIVWLCQRTVSQQKSDYSLNWWTSNPCRSESAQDLTWLPMCTSSVWKLIHSKYNPDNIPSRPQASSHDVPLMVLFSGLLGVKTLEEVGRWDHNLMWSIHSRTSLSVYCLLVKCEYNKDCWPPAPVTVTFLTDAIASQSTESMSLEH